MRLDAVVAIAPDGSVQKIQNGSTGKYRSTFDVAAEQARHLEDRLGLAQRHGQLHRGRRGQALPRQRRGLRQAGPGRRADLKTIKSFKP
jgi:hypothetical protein